QEYLGDTLEEIAAEKAAIIQEGSKVIIAEQKSEAYQIILERCDRFGITPMTAIDVGTTCGSGWLKFESEDAEYMVKQLGLQGCHQIENAKVAILLAETLQEHFQITTENI